jgi:lipopolysaccharide/colanic/teichoic acid biosynthesis glycosyltransferase
MKLDLQLGLKRLADIALAVTGLLLCLPLFLLIALLIWLESPGPVVFRQARSGKNGVPFEMYKFRTMYDGVPHLRNADGSAFIARNDARVTRVGRWLREFSLDEIPQLCNVLRGDMSIVGPRPEKPDYTAELPAWALEKLRVKPGCLSLTLIHGRNLLPWAERNEMDLVYVRDFSMWLDVKILVLGLWTMFFDRKGLYSPPRLVAPVAPVPLEPYEKRTGPIEQSQTASKEQIS